MSQFDIHQPMSEADRQWLRDYRKRTGFVDASADVGKPMTNSKNNSADHQSDVDHFDNLVCECMRLRGCSRQQAVSIVIKRHPRASRLLGRDQSASPLRRLAPRRSPRNLQRSTEMGRVAERAKQIEQTESAPETTDGRLPKDVQNLVNRVADDRAAAHELAEQILFCRVPKIPQESSHFNIRLQFEPAELAVFDALGWSNAQLSQEAARIRGVAHWQAIAGDSASRAKKAAQVEAAKAALGERGPKLKADIEKLTDELARLERSAQSAEADYATTVTAMETLRAKAPDTAKQRHTRALRQLQPLRSKISELTGKLQSIRSVVNLDVDHEPAARERALLHAQTARPELVEGLDPHRPSPNLRGWHSYVEELAAQVPALEQELPTTEAELERQVRAAQELLEVYILQ